MGHAMHGGAADSTPPVPGILDRKGNLPQWIAIILLGIIGTLLSMQWQAIDKRMDALEQQLTNFTSQQMRLIEVTSASAARSAATDTLLQLLSARVEDLSGEVRDTYRAPAGMRPR